jgi:hypothetical protein
MSEFDTRPEGSEDLEKLHGAHNAVDIVATGMEAFHAAHEGLTVAQHGAEAAEAFGGITEHGVGSVGGLNLFNAVMAPVSLAMGASEFAEGAKGHGDENDVYHMTHGAVTAGGGALTIGGGIASAAGATGAGAALLSAAPVAGALGAGLWVGHALDNALGISDSLAGVGNSFTGRLEHAEEARQAGGEEAMHNAMLTARMLGQGKVFDAKVGNYVPLGGPAAHYAD